MQMNYSSSNSDITDLNEQIDPEQFTVDSLCDYGRDIKDIEGCFKNVIKKITIPVLYTAIDEEIKIDFECETCIMTQDIDGFKTEKSQYIIKRNFIRFNPIFEQYKNIMVGKKYDEYTNKCGPDKWKVSSVKTLILQDHSRTKQTSVWKQLNDADIAITIKCGSQNVNGVYINIKYINRFLEYYCPEFKKRQLLNIKQQLLSVIVTHNRKLKNQTDSTQQLLDVGLDRFDNVYQMQYQEETKQLLNNPELVVRNGDILRREQPNIDRNNTEIPNDQPLVIPPEQQQIQNQIDRNPDIQAIKRRLNEATQQSEQVTSRKALLEMGELISDIKKELKQAEDAVRQTIKVGAVYELYIKIMSKQNLFDAYHNRKYWQSSVYIGKTFRNLQGGDESVIQARYFEHINGIESALKVICNQQDREVFISQSSKLEKKYFSLASFVLQIWLNQPPNVPRYKVTDIVGIRLIEGPIYDEVVLGQLEKHHIQSSYYHSRIINNQRYEDCEKLLDQYVSLERSLSRGTTRSLNTRKKDIYKAALSNDYIRDEVASIRLLPYMQFMNRLCPNNDFVVTTEPQAVIDDILQMKQYICDLIGDHLLDAKQVIATIENMPLDQVLLYVSDRFNTHENQLVRSKVNEAIILYYQNKSPWLDRQSQVKQLSTSLSASQQVNPILKQKIVRFQDNDCEEAKDVLKEQRLQTQPQVEEIPKQKAVRLNKHKQPKLSKDNLDAQTNVKGSYNCDYCKADMKCKDNLYVHRFVCEQGLHCAICYMILENNELKHKHEADHHQQVTKVVYCSYCQQKFSTKGERQKHMLDCDQNLQCFDCGKVFTTSNRRKQHVNADNGPICKNKVMRTRK